MKVDTVIVGAGTAGLAALREVQRYTEDFLLVNDGHWGTTCAAVGCMPSKALIEAARLFARRDAFGDFGIRGAEGLKADIPAVLRRVRRMRDRFVEGPASTPRKLGRRAIAARARLNGPQRVTAGSETIDARAIILAPGSRPIIPDAWKGFGDRILTTDSLFEQADLPRRIAVVGMGAIGVEIAQALAQLGLEIAGFDARDTLAGIENEKLLHSYRPLLERDVALHLGEPATLSERNGGIAVTGAGGVFEADAVLAAIGRRPNIENLGLETLDVPLDDTGLPEVDPGTLQIGDSSVYLAGDANGIRPVLHEAADEGHIAGRMAGPAGRASGFCRRTALTIVFSSPQVAAIGQPYARLDRDRIVVGRADFSRQARARMGQRAAGLLEIYADRETGRLLGAELCAPDAEHLAHLLALAIEGGMSVEDMLAMPFYHPVEEEGLRSALRDLARGVAANGRSDLSDCAPIGHDALD